MSCDILEKGDTVVFLDTVYKPFARTPYQFPEKGTKGEITEIKSERTAMVQWDNFLMPKWCYIQDLKWVSSPKRKQKDICPHCIDLNTEEEEMYIEGINLVDYGHFSYSCQIRYCPACGNKLEKYKKQPVGVR